MATLLTAALLGVIQGLTEFLPVSSSAHLILARAFFGWDGDRFGLAFDVALHVGTLVAILVYFQSDIRAMIAAVPAVLTARDGAGKLARLIVIGTLPVVVAGLLVGDWLEAHLRTPAVIAVTLTVGAVALLLAERIGSQRRDGGVADRRRRARPRRRPVDRAGAGDVAIRLDDRGRHVPRHDPRVRGALLVPPGIPAIAAAAAKEGVHLVHAGLSREDLVLFAVGMTVSAAVGYLTIRFFLRFLVGHRLDVFAYYRLALAAVTVLWLMR